MNSLHELQRFLNYVHNGQVEGKKTINYDFLLICTCTVIRSFQLREEENLKKGLQLLFLLHERAKLQSANCIHDRHVCYTANITLALQGHLHR